MQVKLVGNRRWVLVLGRGEEVVSSVTSFLEEQGLRGGVAVGIGALRDLTIGFFDPEKKEYLKRSFAEPMELGNLTGTVGCADGKPVFHAHVTVCGPEMIAFTGHLFRAEVGIAVEIVLADLETDLPRVLDRDTGLKLFCIAGDVAEPGKAGE